MRYILGVPYVNRPDLLSLAVQSIEAGWKHAFILDNSDGGEIYQQKRKWPVPVQRLQGVSLTFTQSMNHLQAMACERKCDACLFMHNDAEAGKDTLVKLLRIIEDAVKAKRKWGVVFTNYDTLAALSMKAVKAVGPWDTNLPHYFADNDYYRRLRLKGYEPIETGLPVTHHSDASATIKSDRKRWLVNSVTFPLFEEYYRRKWGGGPRNETFLKPFGSQLK